VQAKSFSIGLLKNVSGTVGSACSRQEAAQIIYNALNMDILAENALGVKVPSGETILTKYLNGYVDTVVVTGNEYADLNGTSPLDEGKTEVDGKTTLNWSTDLDAIGEAYTIWAVKGGAQKQDTVIYASNDGLNTIDEFKSEVKDLNRAISVKTNSATETYLNFGAGTKVTSDYAINYQTAKDSAVTTIKAGATITTAEQTAIQTAFKEGWGVWVGNKIIDANDVTNLTYKTFAAKYLDTSLTTSVSKNENGNYIKVIDNDGDGYADYILKTQYAVATVTNVAKNGAVTLSDVANATDVNVITKDVKVSAYDDVAEGDVVIYAVIDGIAYTDKADSAEIQVDKQNLNKITITSTDGDTYEQSYIDYMVADQLFEQDIMNLQKNYTYIVYLDKAGYVATATQATQAGEFVLLTDAYYATAKAGEDYAVAAYVDGTISSYDVNSKSTANFIQTNNNDNGWTKLNKFNSGLTTIATYTLDDDNVMSLNVVEDAFNKKTVNMIALDTVALEGNNKALTGTNYTTTGNTTPYNAAGTANQTVNVRSDTVYYYVSKDAVTSKISVKTYTGYASAPKVAATEINKMYAVATKSTNYWVANVVVVELNAQYKGAAENIFVYNYPENVNTLRNATIDIIKADGTTTSVNVANPSAITYGPAYLYGNETDGYSIVPMPTTDYAANRLLAGKVTTEVDIRNADYVGITGEYANGDAYATETRLGDTTGVYYTYSIAKVTSPKNAYDKGTLAEADVDDVLVSKVDVTDAAHNTTKEDNLVFVSYDARGNIIYAISFNQDYAVTVNGTDATKVWNDLRVAAPVAVVTYDSLKAEYDALDKTSLSAVTTLLDKMNAASTDDMTGAQITKLNSMKSDLTSLKTTLTNETNAVTTLTNAYYAEINKHNSDWPAAAVTAAKAAVDTEIAKLTAEQVSKYEGKASKKTDDPIWSAVVAVVQPEQVKAAEALVAKIPASVSVSVASPAAIGDVLTEVAKAVATELGVDASAVTAVAEGKYDPAAEGGVAKTTVSVTVKVTPYTGADVVSNTKDVAVTVTVTAAE
jgi:hypothetical protein